jgi:hypothetical protein
MRRDDLLVISVIRSHLTLIRKAVRPEQERKKELYERVEEVELDPSAEICQDR